MDWTEPKNEKLYYLSYDLEGTSKNCRLPDIVGQILKFHTINVQQQKDDHKQPEIPAAVKEIKS